jgi:hypothetical protein
MDLVILLADSEDLAVDSIGSVDHHVVDSVGKPAERKQCVVVQRRRSAAAERKDAGMEMVLLKCLPSKIS